MSKENKFEWVNAKDRKPEDDQTLLVTNEKVPMLPLMAYYDEQYDEFISLEMLETNHPLSVTHWTPMPTMER